MSSTRISARGLSAATSPTSSARARRAAWETLQGTIWLWVTKNGGLTFRDYKVPALTGYGPTLIRVSGRDVTIIARRVVRKVNSPPYEIYTHKAVTLHVA